MIFSNRLNSEAEQMGVSRSEYIRATLEAATKRTCYAINLRTYRLDYDALKARHDELQRQLAATNQRVDEHQELIASASVNAGTRLCGGVRSGGCSAKTTASRRQSLATPRCPKLALSRPSHP